MFGNNLPPLLPWLRIFLLPAGAAILATYLTMRLLFRRTLQGEIPNVLEDLRLSTGGKLTVLGVIATAGVLLFCSATGKSLGIPTCITAFAITLFITLWDRQAPSGQRVEFFKGRRDCDARGAFAGRSFPISCSVTAAQARPVPHRLCRKRSHGAKTILSANRPMTTMTSMTVCSL
jgi:hypothetical protein